MLLLYISMDELVQKEYFENSFKSFWFSISVLEIRLLYADMTAR